MKTKNIILINAIAILVVFILTNITLLNPKLEISERKPTFEWIGLPIGYIIMIDDNPDFSTPSIIKVEGKTYIPKNNLELGDHYWKVEGFRKSKVQKFTITSTVSLKKEEEGIKNDGNTRLKLNMKPSITGSAILDINKSIKLEKEIEDVRAKQYE